MQHTIILFSLYLILKTKPHIIIALAITVAVLALDANCMKVEGSAEVCLHWVLGGSYLNYYTSNVYDGLNTCKSVLRVIIACLKNYLKFSTKYSMSRCL